MILESATESPYFEELKNRWQREIELGVREQLDAGALQGDETLQARAVVTVDGLEREIVITGDIALSGEPSGSPK